MGSSGNTLPYARGRPLWKVPACSGVDTALGFLVAWVYAAVRPRLGPGPSTAVIASFVVYGVAALQMATYGGVPVMNSALKVFREVLQEKGLWPLK